MRLKHVRKTRYFATISLFVFTNLKNIQQLGVAAAFALYRQPDVGLSLIPFAQLEFGSTALLQTNKVVRGANATANQFFRQSLFYEFCEPDEEQIHVEA